MLGEGPGDLVVVPGFVSNIEVTWEEPAFARFLTRLAGFSRLILFDKRGTGLSDRVANMPSLEIRMDDVRAVMDAVGSQRAALVGFSEGGPMCALFAETFPQRTTALIMAGAYARRTLGRSVPLGRVPQLSHPMRYVRVGRFCLLTQFCCTRKADLRLSLRQTAWVRDALVAPHWDAPPTLAYFAECHRRTGSLFA